MWKIQHLGTGIFVAAAPTRREAYDTKNALHFITNERYRVVSA